MSRGKKISGSPCGANIYNPGVVISPTTSQIIPSHTMLGVNAVSLSNPSAKHSLRASRTFLLQIIQGWVFRAYEIIGYPPPGEVHTPIAKDLLERNN